MSAQLRWRNEGAGYIALGGNGTGYVVARCPNVNGLWAAGVQATQAPHDTELIGAAETPSQAMRLCEEHHDSQ